MTTQWMLIVGLIVALALGAVAVILYLKSRQEAH